MRALEKRALNNADGSKVFKAALENPSGLSGGDAWTPDLHLALYRTAQLGADGQLYEAVTHNGTRSAIHRLDSFYSFWTFWPQVVNTDLLEEYRLLAGDESILRRQFHRPESIHGISHMKRVLLHSFFLSFLEQLSAKDRKVLLYAAAFHDIGRSHDALCERHGADSIEKMKKVVAVQEQLEPEDLRALQFIMRWHCIADQRGVKALGEMPAAEQARIKYLFFLFKDCDALDRVRILDLDFKYLRCRRSWQLALVAYQLLHHLGEVEQEFLL